MATVRRQNQITSLRREDETWTETEQQARFLLVSYFKALYKKEVVPDGSRLATISLEHYTIPTETYLRLTQEYQLL
jgi:hypothetical protein